MRKRKKKTYERELNHLADLEAAREIKLFFIGNTNYKHELRFLRRAKMILFGAYYYEKILYFVLEIIIKLIKSTQSSSSFFEH